MCTWTIFPRSDWNQSDKRLKLHCLRGPSKKQSFWSEYNIHQSVCVWTTYSLEMLFGRFQSVSSSSWFVQHFTGIQLCSSFQYLVWMTSCVKPSNRRGVQQSSTENLHRLQTSFVLLPPCFCVSWKHRHLMSPPQREYIHSNQREMIWTSVYMADIFLSIGISKVNQASRSDWKLIHVRRDRVIFDGNIR